ncbi:extracellular solute-binding protein [Vagococcus salmoninarum]|uniref:extracellular solute-binding protein n=1 Tax=Vagococcus salmoninarum TaxID=2739 RepID=UPI003F9DD14D
MKNKQLKWLLPVLLFSGVVLIGCSNTNQGDQDQQASDVVVETTGFPIVKETLEMTLMAPGTGLVEWDEMATMTDYAEQTNINFKYTTPPLSDFGTKLNLAFASGDLADIIFAAGSNLTAAMEVDYGEQGILVPLEELIPTYAPNLHQLMEAEPDIRKSITATDGHIYSLPGISRGDTAIWPRGPVWYNGTWLEKLNVTELPKTTDEFYELLLRFKNEDPNDTGAEDSIPMSDSKLDSLRPWLLSAFGIKSLGIEEVGGQVRYAPMTENYQGYLTYMHKLYQEGLIDAEVYSQSDEQKKSKGQNNQLGVFPDWFSYFTTGQTEDEAINNPMFHPLTSPFSETAIVPGSPRLVRGVFAITKDNPSPAASLRWVDHFYSEAGYEYMEQGPEGVLWEYQENSQGEAVKVYAPGIDPDKGEEERGKVSPAYGLAVPGLSASTPQIRRAVTDSDENVFNQFIKTETQEKIEKFAEVPYPLVYLTKEEQDKVSASATDLATYIEQMEAKFITGVEPLSNWDKFIDTIESMGIAEYVSVYQEAYDKWEGS